MQVIYIDVLFLLNLVMDFCIFRISVVFLNRKVKWMRLMLASIMAALLACVGVISGWSLWLPNFLGAILLPVLPLLYLIKPIKLTDFLKTYLVTCTIAWAVGGIAFNLYFLGQSINVVSIWIPIFSAVVSQIILETSMNWFRRRRIHLYYNYEIQLYIGDKCLTFKGFLDTGNQLYTLDHQPVNIIGFEDIKSILPTELLPYLELEGEKLIEALASRQNTKTKLYLIPFDSIGCQEGLLVGIVMDKMIVRRGSHKEEIDGCIWGISKNSVVTNNEFQGLIHPEMIIG